MESDENYNFKVTSGRQSLPKKNSEYPLAGSDFK